MSGGGGNKDGGAGARASEDRARKKEATDKVNSIFGISSGDRPAAAAPLKGGDTAGLAWDKRNEGTARNRAAREASYDRNKSAVYDFNKSKLDQDFSKSDRDLRFHLARQGQTGGSVDIDNRDTQNLAYDKGALQAKSMGDEAANKFRGSDESARLDVINQIQSGVDSGSAISSAQRGIELSADKADATARGNAIGNVFKDIGLLYDNDQYDKGIVEGRKQYADGTYFRQSGDTGTRRTR